MTHPDETEFHRDQLRMEYFRNAINIYIDSLTHKTLFFSHLILYFVRKIFSLKSALWCKINAFILFFWTADEIRIIWNEFSNFRSSLQMILWNKNFASNHAYTLYPGTFDINSFNICKTWTNHKKSVNYQSVPWTYYLRKNWSSATLQYLTMAMCAILW